MSQRLACKPSRHREARGHFHYPPEFIAIMPLEFNDTMQKVMNDLLVWVGFGTLVGLLAKAIMPGRDPGGAVATTVMGIAGCIMGCGTLMFFWEGHRVTPISPLGFVCGTAGAFLILLFYRLLGGRFFVEGDTQPRKPHFRPSKKRVKETIEIDD